MSGGEDDMGKLKTGVEIVGQIIQLAGEQPDVKASATQLGKTALTLTKTINNALLPLAAVNFAFDRAREYFASKFPQDIQERAGNIPPDEIIEPKASIAGPALQGLAFAHEEDNLRELFLELLASAMDQRRAGKVHPAFVEILRQLDSTEAALLKSLLRTATYHPIATLEQVSGAAGERVAEFRHVMNSIDTETKQPSIIENFAAMVDNWSRLGLVAADYTVLLPDPDRYAWLENRPEWALVKLRDGFEPQWHKGVLRPTALGSQFALAVGIFGKPAD